MLTHLHLRDFAVATDNDVALSGGFTVLTGETGAGKSLLVDALLCLTGARADAGMVRHGAARAELSAQFSLDDAPEALAWLREHELDEDQTCQLRRVIHADGGSKSWINGRSATLSQLAALGAHLLEIHGQHEQQTLLERRRQLALLDDAAGAGQQSAQVRQAYRHWHGIDTALRQLQARGDVDARIAELEHQLAELQRQPLQPESIDAALARHKRHSQSAQLLSACSTATRLLDGDDGNGALALLRAGMAQIGRWQDGDAALAEVHALLESADVQMKEALSQLQHLLDGIELDGAELAELEAQIGHWHALSRRHRVPLDALHAKHLALETELATLRDAGQQAGALTAELTQARRDWQLAADALGTVRRQAAQRLSAEVSGLMAELGMAGGLFAIELEANPDADPQAHGAQRCEFLVSANPGQPPRPLRKVASGGELARIALAIEVATLGADPVPTMLFDEVDSGIGGAVAETVGRKLRALGGRCQVLAVTHLAQVASQAHHHLQVAKDSEAGQAESRVSALQTDARVQEIARMLGGATLGPETLAHARAMLAHGQS